MAVQCLSQRKQKLNAIREKNDLHKSFFPAQAKTVLIALAKGIQTKEEFLNFFNDYLSSHYPQLIEVEIQSMAIFLAEVARELMLNLYQVSNDIQYLVKKKGNIEADIVLKTNSNTNAMLPLPQNSYVVLRVENNHSYSEKARSAKNNPSYNNDLKALSDAFPNFNVGVISLKPNNKTMAYKIAMFDPSKYDEDKANAVDKENECDCSKCAYQAICEFADTIHLFKSLDIKNKKDFYEIKDTSKSVASKEVKLDPEQQLVVSSIDGIYRTNAVAGAGKTTVLVERLFRILKSGTKGDGIYVLSFTDRGIKEIESRFLERNKQDKAKNGFAIFNEASNVHFHSFNSLGQEFLDDHFKEFGFQSRPKLASTYNKLMFAAKASTSFESIQEVSYNSPFSFSPKKGAFFLLVETIDAIKHELIVNQRTLNDKEIESLILNKMETIPSEVEKVKNIYLAYEEILKENNCIDYVDQIKYALIYLTDDSTKQIVSHIIVDEYQDSDKSHLAIIKLMMSKTTGLMVVGDDAQAIYGFRGVTPENMLSMNKDFPKLKDLFITTNYRCSKVIAYAANRILSRNRFKIPKTLKPRKDAPDGYIDLIENDTDKVLRSIQSQIDSHKNKEIVILTKSNKKALEWAMLLAKNEIPVSIDLAIQSTLVKAFLALIKYYYTSDFSELVYFISLTKLKMVEEIELLEVLDLKDSLDLIFSVKKAPNIIEQLHSLFIDFATPQYGEKNVVEFLYLIEERYSFHELTNLLRLLDEGKGEIKRTTTVSAELIGQKPVRCCTIHNAKGSEYDSVILDMTDSVKNVTAAVDDEEVKRLLYVAITRAKQDLTVLFTKDKVRAFEPIVFNSCVEAINQLYAENMQKKLDPSA